MFFLCALQKIIIMKFLNLTKGELNSNMNGNNVQSQCDMAVHEMNETSLIYYHSRKLKPSEMKRITSLAERFYVLNRA